MAHERKKGGVRKDKKVERMREDVAERKSKAKPKTTTDQWDVQTQKPGSASDKSKPQARAKNERGKAR
ncbi:MAG: hypothetical protein U0R49_10830 [Fimbriimonadales bacterium]